MKKFVAVTVSVVVCIAASVGAVSYKTKINASKIAVTSKNTQPILTVADFDSGAAPNNVGGSFGSWDKDPADDSQSYKAEILKPGYDGTGCSLKLSYDVDSPNVAYGGLWMKLEDIDVRPYSKLSFWLKGDEKLGFTKKFKIEIKNKKGESSSYYVTDSSDLWDVVEIPLASFNKITDWSKMSEFVIVLESDQVTQKSGAIYFDDISFVK
ncbi:MAG TPA: hypothetical protein DEE98_08765 [Elusimicrobia bacterium]|nr:MAG: hypothetical protein A2386_03040 [Elusimicrobia bacterium RIFOXYB1_FULL_48_9]OGS15696.1 MAG: hypothetical protein A2251_08385 [Elusimicrobia bacterium RIFOXYA2_FULL_47_53]OGS27085.1 MAG: hypothetical protein A2339_01235 [Elusimicrobia bacterium RIFOXYB12_FULL_50_12]OGS30997.1 MAG: hypothetical protein A2323_06705 [Elusimicrobia bacterium RIFOXYB2_FULL_46_23]HBU70453.1 hypothetical protein [Elusimicrobiota bacterium]